MQSCDTQELNPVVATIILDCIKRGDSFTFIFTKVTNVCKKETSKLIRVAMIMNHIDYLKKRGFVETDNEFKFKLTRIGEDYYLKLKSFMDAVE